MKNFTRIPNSAFNLELSSIEFHVLCYLLKCRNSVTGKCFPSYSRIERDCHISRSSVVKAVKHLEAKSIITVTRNYRKQVMRSNSYEINLT
ncbi:MAG: helix-turn-helix domain-containing protein [Oscillospiraceae bacterium]|nr:helix-turn-helix domain-containing protein [Oscillospiraceae bacterium]